MSKELIRNNPSNYQFDNYDARKDVRKHLLGFSLIYLTGHFTDPSATFHTQLARIARRGDNIRWVRCVRPHVWGIARFTLGQMAVN